MTTKAELREPLRILQIGTGRAPIPPIGTFAPEQAIHSLSVELVRLGHHVTVIDVPSGCRPHAPYRVLEVATGPQGYVGPAKAVYRGIRFGMGVARILRRLSKVECFDVVSAHFQFPATFAALCWSGTGTTPMVYWTHAPVSDAQLGEHGWGSRRAHDLEFWLERRVMKGAAAIVCETVAQARIICRVTRLRESRIRVIPHGIEDDWFVDPGEVFHPESYPRGREMAVLCVAKIDRRKNQLRLVEALPLVLRSVPSAQFWFAGTVADRVYMQEIVQAVERLGVSSSVRFYGEVPRVSLRELYLRAGVFAFPSQGEATGVALLEAMASGLPVVAFDIEPVREVVPRGCGVLAPPGDAGAFAKAIVGLLTDPASGRSMAAGAIAAARGMHSWSSVALQHVQLYCDIRQHVRDREATPE